MKALGLNNLGIRRTIDGASTPLAHDRPAIDGVAEQLAAEPCFPDTEETPLSVHLQRCWRCCALLERYCLQRLGVRLDDGL